MKKIISIQLSILFLLGLSFAVPVTGQDVRSLEVERVGLYSQRKISESVAEKSMGSTLYKTDTKKDTNDSDGLRAGGGEDGGGAGGSAQKQVAIHNGVWFLFLIAIAYILLGGKRHEKY
jgi:hypothetical protein